MPDYTTNYGLIKPSDNETADIAVINQNMDTIDGQFKQNENAVVAHLAENVHIPYAAAAGAVNAYTVTLDPAPLAYTEGMAIAIKINLGNTGISTINVNGLGAKSIKKANGNDVSAGNLKAGSVYTLRYNGVNFILQGEGGDGTAQPGEVLASKTFTNDSGEQTGTMPNRGQQILTPGTANIAIPAGYHDGTGYVVGDADLIAANIKAGANIFNVAGNLNVVDTSPGTALAADILASKIAFVNGVQLTGTMVDRGTVNITPSTVNQTILGGKHSGAGVVYGDADLIATNIKAGANIFGVQGSLTPLTGTHLPIITGGVVNDVITFTAVTQGVDSSLDFNISDSLAFGTRCVRFRAYSNNRSCIYSDPIDITPFSQLIVDIAPATLYGTTVFYIMLSTSISISDITTYAFMAQLGDGNYVRYSYDISAINSSQRIKFLLNGLYANQSYAYLYNVMLKY